MVPRTQQQAAGCRRDERGRRHAVGQGGAVQAEVGGGHPGEQRRDAEPEEVDDEDGGDEPAAAVFNPLRRRMQAMVDRRFDRARYDAERVVAQFSVQLRDRSILTCWGMTCSAW